MGGSSGGVTSGNQLPWIGFGRLDLLCLPLHRAIRTTNVRDVLREDAVCHGHVRWHGGGEITRERSGRPSGGATDFNGGYYT